IARAALKWFFHCAPPPRYAPDVKVIQLDIAPEEIGHNRPTDVALVGDGKAIMQQMNKALGGRQGFHPKESQWRQMIAHKNSDLRMSRRSDRRSRTTARPAATTGYCATSPNGCRRIRSSAPRAPARW